MNTTEMKKCLCMLFILILVPCLSGCSDDDTGVTATPKTYGTAMDGLLNGATVVFDANDNGELDSGEYLATTNSVGQFEVADTSSPLVVTGGTDIATGKTFSGTLTCPASGGGEDIVVTPVTTLVKALVDSGAASSASAAQTTIKQNFGIDASVDLLTFNPIKTITESGADTTDIKEATKLNAVGTQIINTISTVRSAVEASSTTTLTNKIKRKIRRAIAKSMSGSKRSDLKDTTKLTTIIDNAVTQVQTDVTEINVDTTKINTVKNSIVSRMKALNEESDTVFEEADALTDATISAFNAKSKLTSISTILYVAADTEDEIGTAVTTGSSSTIDSTTSAIDTKIQDAADNIGDVTGENTTPTDIPTVTASAGGAED